MYALFVTRDCRCVSAAAFPHYCTDPDVTWGNGMECPLVVHFWADLQSMHGFRCYDDNIARTRNISECLYSLYAWFQSLSSRAKCQRCIDVKSHIARNGNDLITLLQYDHKLCKTSDIIYSASFWVEQYWKDIKTWWEGRTAQKVWKPLAYFQKCP